MFNIDKYGELVIDKILFEANYPILFTCTDGAYNLFLVVCCQNNAEGRKWLLTKTDEKNIIEMLEDKISIREAFLKNSESQITVFCNEEMCVTEHDEFDWGENSIYLPKKGEFMEAEPGEFDDEISYYGERLKTNKKINFEISYNKIFNTVQTINDRMELFADLVLNLPELDGDINIDSVKIQLKTSEKMYLETFRKVLVEYLYENPVKKDATEKIIYSGNSKIEKHICIIDAENEENYLSAA